MITGNQALISALCAHHELSLVSHRVWLQESSSVNNSDVLVLDAAGIRPTLGCLIQTLRRRRPDLPIVLVDGGLSEDDKANAFSLGVCDYFPSPCNVDLLVERLAVLGRARRD
jgi:DNA-binding response OmpR family regulator